MHELQRFAQRWGLPFAVKDRDGLLCSYKLIPRRHRHAADSVGTVCVPAAVDDPELIDSITSSDRFSVAVVFRSTISPSCGLPSPSP